jgi:hypothetical protein
VILLALAEGTPAEVWPGTHPGATVSHMANDEVAEASTQACYC